MNSKLPLMNTIHRSIPLQSGQALAVDRHRSARLVLTEGEVLLQAPAQWLGDTVVLMPPHRVVAPAALPSSDIHAITAIGAAKIHVEDAPGPLERLKSAWSELRFAWGGAVLSLRRH